MLHLNIRVYPPYFNCAWEQKHMGCGHHTMLL